MKAKKLIAILAALDPDDEVVFRLGRTVNEEQLFSKSTLLTATEDGLVGSADYGARSVSIIDDCAYVHLYPSEIVDVGYYANSSDTVFASRVQQTFEKYYKQIK